MLTRRGAFLLFGALVFLVEPAVGQAGQVGPNGFENHQPDRPLGSIIDLDNGAIRVEVEPRLFSVRFVGFSGGPNFVQPLTVGEAAAVGSDWVDAGGMHTDLIPFAQKDAAVRRGPAEVIERRPDYVAMLGPASEQTGMRIKKEVQLLGKSARARFRVTALRVGEGAARFALRNTVRLPEKSTIRIERTDGDVKAVGGTESTGATVVRSRRYWIIPVPPTQDTKGVVLGAFVPRVITVNDSGSWTRRLVSMPKSPEETPNAHTLLCVLDDPSRSYGVSLQGAAAEVKKGETISLEEEWVFDARGR